MISLISNCLLLFLSLLIFTFTLFFTMLSDVLQCDVRQTCEGGIFMTQPNTLQYGLRSVRYAGAKS